MSRQGTYATRQEPRPGRTNMAIPATTATALNQTVTVEWVGPDEAAEYLKRNLDRNRRIKPSVVALYAQDMTEGNWGFSNDAICFDRDEVLINGQHRLHAILISGTAQEFLVIRGMDTLAFEYMDIGPNRGLADILDIKQYSNANAVAAIAAKVAGYAKAGYLNSAIVRNGSNGKPGGALYATRRDKLQAAAEIHEIRYAASLGKRLAKAGKRLGLAASQVGFLYVLYQSRHPGIEDFMERVVNLSHDERGERDPARRVGMRLLDAHNALDVNKYSPEVRFGYMVLAANADFQGRQLGKLQWRRRNQYPQPVFQVATGIANRLGWRPPRGTPEEES